MHITQDLDRKMTWYKQWLSTTLQQQRENWIVSTPKFKYCKKRKEFFTDDFTDTWYKSPYKYHMLLTTYNVPSEVSVKLNLIYEDGTKVEDESPVTITETLTTKVKGTEEQQHVIGPFQFNVCSYKHEGRRFKVQICLMLEEVVIYQMNSPSFIIKAKKPISKPGLKNKKRKREDEEEEEEEESEEDLKRRKVELLKERSFLFSPLAPKIPIPMNFRQLLPSSNAPLNQHHSSNLNQNMNLHHLQHMQHVMLPTSQPVQPTVAAPTIFKPTTIITKKKDIMETFNHTLSNFDQYFGAVSFKECEEEEYFGDFFETGMVHNNNGSLLGVKVEENILNQFDGFTDAERLETMENLMDSNRFEEMNFCKFEKDSDYLFDNDVDQFFVL
jgi:hypothetical protein